MSSSCRILIHVHEIDRDHAVVIEVVVVVIVVSVIVVAEEKSKECDNCQTSV